ncbi:inositol monophosphatase family protein [uncultured Aureimonas sp.]|uniref:inositol monophosphatase family protein n=1 Tax=uncultured Aureimonas sp. TaxID=1604662 RepID=UPI0025F552AB|nr:inositol monophosphatase family protein [uncultured Aureimonas sp.]
MARSALMNVMTQAAMKAGRSLTRDFGEVQNLQVSMKGPADFVSHADRKAEEIVFQELSRARPDWGFLMEERGAIEGRDPQHRWIVDPLDGTTNFLHGIPHFAISIGLERDGQIVAGVIFNPATDELYSAEKGGGAFLNDRRIRVAARTKLAECVLATGIPHLGHADHARYLFEARKMMGEAAGIRAFGSASLNLAYVAAGRIDGFWEHSLQPWDVAAGSMLVREAGGFVTHSDGSKFEFVEGDIACGNEIVHRALVGELKKAATAMRGTPKPKAEEADAPEAAS